MGMRLNQFTGQMEDDGTGAAVGGSVVAPTFDPLAGADPAAVIPPAANVGGGAAQPTNISVTTAPPTQPGWEVQQGSSTKVESAAEKRAVADLKGAARAEAEVGDQAVALEQEEGAIRADGIGDKVQLTREEIAAKEAREREFAAELARLGAEERKAHEQAAKSKVKAGSAKADAWEGNPIGWFVSSIVRAVGAAEMARVGKDGISPAERILNEAMANYEAKLVAKAEGDAEIAKLKTTDKAKYEAVIATVRKLAADKNAENIKLADLVTDEAIAKLDPRKRAIAQEQKNAAIAKVDAANEVKRTEGLRATKTWERTEREKPRDTEVGEGINPVLDPFTGKVIGQLPKERATEGKAHRDQIGSLNGLRGWKGEFKKFIAKHGNIASKWTPDARQELTTLVTEGAGYLTQMNQTGVLNDKEYDRYLAQMTPSGVLGLFASNKASGQAVDQIIKGAERRAVGQVRTLKTDYAAPEGWDKPTGSTARDKSAEELRVIYEKAVKAKSPKAEAIREAYVAKVKQEKGAQAQP